ncbi:MAG: hypothetical protein ABSF15_07635 [Candidatus Sulfotelmatobacter sp.]|jgi:hypothetical protein
MPTRKSTNRKPPKSPAAVLQADAEQQLDSFLAKYDREATAFEGRSGECASSFPVPSNMVYDNYNWLVVGFTNRAPLGGDLSPGASTRPRDLVLSARRGPARSRKTPAGKG